MPKLRALTIAVLFVALLGAPMAWGQEGAAADGFFIESITPRESISPTADDGQSGLVPNTNEYEIELRLPSGMALYQAFERKEIQLGGVWFDTGIAEETHTQATLSLGSRTQMNLTRDETAVRDVLQSLVSERSVTGMQLQQGFGGGSSGGQLTLSRMLTSERKGYGDELRTLEQSAALQTGLGAGTSLAASFSQRESEESPLRLSETSYRGTLKMALSGGEALAHYDYLDRLLQGRRLQTRVFDLKAPFAVEGGTALAEHHLSEKITDSSEEIHRVTKLDVPLDMVRSGAHMAFNEETKIKGGSRDEKSVLTLSTPMNLFGHESTLQHILTETVKGEAWTEQRVTRLASQFSGGQGVLERTETVQPQGEGLRHHERLRLATPRVSLADFMSLSASQVRDKVDGDETSRVSHIALNVQPFHPLEVQAGYTLSERPGASEVSNRDVQTMLALSPSTSLRGRIMEAEQVDGSPTILRYLELARKPGGLDMRVGYTSYGVQEQQEDTAVNAEVSVGANSDLGLQAAYAEFDEKKRKPLPEPSTSVELRAGDPAQVGLRAGFVEQASRPQPERSMGMAMGALGGSLVLDYIRNPLDPRGKQTMLSDVYELGYRRKIFGSVSMDLGYRYFLPHGVDTETENFWQLKLDGGQEERGGQIALWYRSGHFVPYPKRGEPPASLLDLTYKRRWPGDEGRLILTVSREEPPEMSVGLDDNVEAEVKYETLF
ncbi:MAG: hypothetical protein U9R79_21915 [Armatimonadota bacterium]|nr:hypothetical protein [Armatimonadota bacterium]